jgi:hypothetical protein
MRFTGFVEVQRKWWTYWQANALYSPESLGTVSWPGRLYQTSWTYTPTNRLLIEAGANFQVSDDEILPRAGEPNTGLRIVETGGSLTGPITYGPFGNIVSDAPQHQHAYRASVSYVTGANNLKVGMDLRNGFRTENNANFANDVQYRTTNFVLNQVSVFAPLGTWTSRLDYNLGIYAQDRWTLHRLTVTAGLRLEDQSESNEPYTVGPSTYLPTRNRSDAGGNVLNWKELNPRAGVAYDVFGNGKTAWKFSAARGVTQEAINTADTLSYARRFGFSAPPGGVSVCGSGYTSECTTRTVNDAVALGGNSNGLPDCDLRNPAANGECGPQLQPFGTALPTTSQDPATLNGWFKRPWNWEFSTSVQQELAGRVSVGLSYFRRISGNFLVTDNLANTASDFRQFPVVVPAGLPNAGASLQVFDISPSLVSATRNLITYASNHGNQYQHYNGVDLIGSARLVRSAMISGGLTFGKIMTDNCDVVKQLPEALGTNGLGGNGFTLTSMPLDYCHAESGWVPQVKLFGSYVLPGAVRVSGNFQSLPGPQVLANVNYTGASLASAIGGPFSAGPGGLKTVQEVQPGSLYGDRLNQLDLRFSKVFKLGGKRTLDANFDLYNAFNSDAVLAETTVFGATWRKGTAIIQGRLVKLGARLDF